MIDRRKLNHDIRALAHGRLSLDEETYRSVVESITGKRHVTELGDEEANLVYLALQKMLDNQGARGEVRRNPQQQKFIARLMQYLHWNWEDAAHFAEKIVHKKSTKACNAAELSKIIRGMIAIIDSDIEKGKIVLNHTERFEYERHVNRHRTSKTAA